MFLNKKILFLIIFLLAAFFRLYGTNWDQGQHLHPDERFLVMVTNAMKWPSSLSEILNTATSTMNPHNIGYDFFVYGTFPLFLTKWVATITNTDTYGLLLITGRISSALFDLGTVFLIYIILRRVNKSATALLASFIYACSVLPIQLSHFYAVETFLLFFLMLTFFLGVCSLTDKKKTNNFYLYPILMGISFGLAIASKISSVIFFPIIVFLILASNISLKKLLIFSILFVIPLCITVRVAQPYLFASADFISFTLNPKLLENWKQLSTFMDPESGFPPSVQWYSVNPPVFAFKSQIFSGFGIPLGIISLLSVIYVFKFFLDNKKYLIKGFVNHDVQEKNYLFIILLVSWVGSIGIFIYQGIQKAPTFRYFHPIYPLIAIIVAFFLTDLLRIFKRSHLVIMIIFSLILVYPLSFMSIYTRPHSRVLASEWIYKNIPSSKVLAIEHWDDGLPLTLDSSKINSLYKTNTLTLYDPDTLEKWQKLSSILSQTDYIVMTSNRLWASIPQAEKLFPITKKYYKKLFDGSLGFEKLAETTSFPSIPVPLPSCVYLLPPQEVFIGLKTEKGGFIRIEKCNWYEGVQYQGIIIRDDSAEETFTVYDHPKVIIMKKVRPVDYLSVLSVQ